MLSLKCNKDLEKYFPYVLFLAICFSIIFLQVKYKVAIYNVDVYFHFSRFYDTAQQIKTGNISLFQLNYGFYQVGRFINVVYGPVFAYLMGAILLATGTWFKFQVFTAFVISFITVSGFYFCLDHYWPENRLANSIIACIYLSSNYTWNNGTMFLTISLMLFPMALYAGLRMVTNNSKPIEWIQLGIIMAIICQIHIVSVVVFSIALTIFFFIGFNKTNRKKEMCLELIKAIALFFILTVNVWGPILYFHSVDQIYNPAAFDMTKYGYGVAHVLVILIPQTIYIFTHFRESKINNIITLWSAALLFISSKVFPWGIVQVKFPIIREIFQMPMRLSIIIYGLLLTGVAISCSEITKHQRDKNNLFIPSILLIFFLSNYSMVMSDLGAVSWQMRFHSVPNIQNYGKSPTRLTATLDLMHQYYYPDYLPKNKDLSLAEGEKEYFNKLDKRVHLFEHKVLPHAKLQLTWNSHTAKKEVLPIVMYKNSQLLINGKKQHITKNGIGIPTIKAKKGKNIAVLSYNIPKLLLISFVISLIGWISVISVKLKQFFQKSKTNIQSKKTI